MSRSITVEYPDTLPDALHMSHHELEDLFENLLDCPDESAWLARLRAAAGEG